MKCHSFWQKQEDYVKDNAIDLAPDWMIKSVAFHFTSPVPFLEFDDERFGKEDVTGQVGRKVLALTGEVQEAGATVTDMARREDVLS